jgi:alpha-L-rhamnosidase
MDICEKAAFIFGVLGMDLHREFAEKFGARLRAAIRFRLIDFSAVTAAGNCQTAQAMVLYFNVLENGERAAFFSKLLALIDRDGGLMTTGLLGARVIFHVLSAFGESDLAYQMITTPEFPSYGNLVARGETSIPEMFQPEGGRVASLNHHMFGDISGWFIREIAGIHLNPSRDNVNEILIRPSFIGSLEYAKGFHIAPAGKISVFWKRNETGAVDLNLEAPETVFGKIVLPEGFRFEDGRYEKSAVTGGHRLVREY